MTANKLFNSLLGLLTVERGQAPSDAEIAKLLQISPSTLSRYKSEEIKLEQVEILLRLLQELPKESWEPQIKKYLNSADREKGWFSLPTPRIKEQGTIKLGPLEIEANEQLRLLVTGSTGTGKTLGVTKPLISQLCTIYKEDSGRNKKWGGLITCVNVDELLGTLIVSMQQAGRDPLQDILLPTKASLKVIHLQDPKTNKDYYISGEGPETAILLSGSNIYPKDLKDNIGSIFETGELLYTTAASAPSQLKLIDTLELPYPDKYNPFEAALSNNVISSQLVACGGYNSDERFWQHTSQKFIEVLLDIYEEVAPNPPTLETLYNFVSSQFALDDIMRSLEELMQSLETLNAADSIKRLAELNNKRRTITEEWSRLDKKTMQCIRMSIGNWLGDFCKPELSAKYCQPSSFSLSDIYTKGKVVLLDIENTFFAKLVKTQMLALTTARSKNGEDAERLSMLICDETWNLLTEDDASYLARARQARLGYAFITQSEADLHKLVTNNIGEHIWFRNFDQGAQENFASLTGAKNQLSKLGLFECITWNSNRRGEKQFAHGSCEVTNVQYAFNQEKEALRWYWKEKAKEAMSK